MVFAENKNQILSKIKNTNSLEDLEKLRLYYLGKKGIIPEALKELIKLSIEEKKSKGHEINQIKKFVEENLREQKITLENLEITKRINLLERLLIPCLLPACLNFIFPVPVLENLFFKLLLVLSLGIKISFY